MIDAGLPEPGERKETGMTVFVLGHGAYWEGEESVGPAGKYTLVPDGMRIFFYARPDEGLLPMNALEVLRNNGAGGYIDAADPGTQIPNYCLSPLDDFEYRFMLSGAQPGQDVRFIGREALASVDRLCTTSGWCTTARHSCTGLFSRVNDSAVHLLSCRVGPLDRGTTAAEAVQYIAQAEDDTDAMFRNTYHLPGESPEDPQHYRAIQRVAEDILELARPTQSGDGVCFEDPENAQAGALFDAQDEAMQIKLMAVQQVQIWSYQRYARMTVRGLIESNNVTGLAAWKSGLKDQEKRWYSWDPYLRQSLALLSQPTAVASPGCRRGAARGAASLAHRRVLTRKFISAAGCRMTVRRPAPGGNAAIRTRDMAADGRPRRSPRSPWRARRATQLHIPPRGIRNRRRP
jgi:hypothetical protein